MGSALTVWREHLRNPALLASFAIGFLILIAFIGTFTYINFVLVRLPISLSAMSLGLVYFVFVPAILTTPFAGYLVKRLGPQQPFWGALLIALAGLLLLLSESLARILCGACLGRGGNVFRASSRNRVRWSCGIDRPRGGERNLSCLLLLRRRCG